MESYLVYTAGSTPACCYAADCLKSAGVSIIDHPSPEVTHLLLDIPSFGADGTLRGGGEVEKLLNMLPQEITVIGGNLVHPALAGYKLLDLLRDPGYVTENAAITADCALRVAAEKLPVVFRGCPVLIIGWGRIGKCLGQMLKALGARVTIAARKEVDRAMLKALGYSAVDMTEMEKTLPGYRVIFNTAPEPVVSEAVLSRCQSCLKIDLASRKGLAGSDVIWARGLPGIYAPESSGTLIGKRIVDFLREDRT